MPMLKDRETRGDTTGANRSRKPRVVSPCVADRYAAPFERIAEFSFPRSGKGGLISLRETPNGPVVEIYREDPEVTVIVPRRTVWALYVSTAKYSVNGISLHTTEVEAYQALYDYIRAGHEDDYNDIPTASDDLVAWLEEHDTGDDWYLQEVSIPWSTLYAR